MITIISDKKLAQIKSEAFASGRLNGTSGVMDCVINTMLEEYDGTEHVFLSMVSPILADLSSEGILSLTQAMELTSRFSRIAAEIRRLEKKPKKKTKKISKKK